MKLLASIVVSSSLVLFADSFVEPLYARDYDANPILAEYELHKRAYEDAHEELTLARRALIDFEDEIEHYVREQAGYSHLAAREAEVPGVSEKCAECLMEGLKYTKRTLPEVLSKEEYNSLDLIGVQCIFDGKCSEEKNSKGLSEAAVWKKAQGHKKGEASSESGGSGGSGKGKKTKKT